MAADGARTIDGVRATRDVKLIGHGLYDATEVARLVGVSVDTILRWSAASGARPALIEPQLDPFFSFHDLLTLKLVRELAARSVPLRRIAAGIRYLQKETGVPRPFAHERMATSGRDWLMTDVGGDHVDVGRGGQLAWSKAVEPTLRALTYDQDGMATIWRPADRVWLNPRVQAGASCIDHSRTTTRFIWTLAEAGTDVHDIAWQFEIELADVLAAHSFETSLENRVPLHAGS